MSVEQILILGVNHKTAPVAVREKLAFPDIEVPLAMLGEVPGCEEYCFLSTCNRVEVIFTSSDPEKTTRHIRSFLFASSDLTEDEAIAYTYLHQGTEAITHLYRVAASLDSMVVGEPQILGQLKNAYREASERNCTGVILNRLIHKAFSAAKRVRSETNIGSSAVSISYAAVQLAKKIFGDLKNKKVLLAGAGEMAELAAEHLVAQGCTEVIVANRTLENAVKLAKRFKGKAVSLAELHDQLEVVDIMVSSTGAPHLILQKDDVLPLMRTRRNRPLFFIDIAVPRDLDPEINEIDNVYLYDVDDLSQVVEINKSDRATEATKAERIVLDEGLKFLGWLGNMALAPTITDLRKKADEIRLAEMEKTLASLDLSEKEVKAIDKLTSAIINKLLHNPILHLKDDCHSDTKQLKLDMIRRFFDLDPQK
jgi:glutamyl-tRNA reductase